MEWLDKKLVITMGTGGVGKTTVSAALAIRAAMEGRRVLVMTIDPSQRLKTALGLDSLSTKPVALNLPDAAKGSLQASFLDPKKVFDSFVCRNVQEESLQKKILENRLYKKISSALSGSQEFTAIELVLTYVNSGDYDLVVLDTPPAQNAVDFLRAPQKFYRLFDDKVLSWFQPSSGAGWVKKLVSASTQKATQVLEKLVGREFLGEIYEFFQAIAVLAPIVRKRAKESQNVFASNDTVFALVSVFDDAKMREAADLYKLLKREGYSLSYMFMNKAFPFAELRANEKGLAPLLSRWQAMYSYQAEMLGGLEQIFGQDVSIQHLKEQSGDISSLEALIKLGDSISV